MRSPVGFILVATLCAACSDDSGSGASGGSGGATDGGGEGTGGDPGTGGADGGGGVGGEGGGAGGAAPSKRVFVSAGTYDGDLGGLDGADAECQALADGEDLGGSWRAWLSDTLGATPETRFMQSADPYVLVGGAQIAADWSDLIDGTIDAPINRDQTGTVLDDDVAFTWTGTSYSAQTVTPCCTDWSDGTTSGGGVGLTTAMDGTWSFTGGQPCTMVAHIYCFEQ